MRAIEALASGTVGTLERYAYYPTIEEIEGPSTEPLVHINGREYLNFASNCYLGIGMHPKIIEAIERGLHTYGICAGASRLTAGTTTIHRQLEECIAEFKGQPDAVVFSAGMLANMGVIPALTAYPLKALTLGLDPSRTEIFPCAEIFIDSLDHASIIDGSFLASGTKRQSNCKLTLFRHQNLTHLEHRLKKSTAGNKLIIVDGVFSLHGHIAPLDEIVSLANRYDASVYLDDAHGTGVLGKTGKGTAEYFGVEDHVEVQMGTFSKALASSGAFITGSTALCRYLRVASRTFMFQTAMPAAQACGIIAAIDIVRNESWRRMSLHANADYIRKELTLLGYDTLGSESQIIPILIGPESNVKDVEKILLEEGIFAPCYYYPAVPKGQAVVRINLLATHTETQLNRLLAAITKAIPQPVPELSLVA